MSAPIAKAVIGYVSPAKFKKKMRTSNVSALYEFLFYKFDISNDILTTFQSR